MAKLNFALLCGRSIVDQGTNLFSIIDVVEEITLRAPAEANKDPSAVFVIQSPMDLVIDFSRSQVDEPETARVRVNVLAPDGAQIGGADLDLDMQASVRCRGLMRLSGMPVASQGIFTFAVCLLGPRDNWLTVAEVTVPVKILPAA